MFQRTWTFFNRFNQNTILSKTRSKSKFQTWLSYHTAYFHKFYPNFSSTQKQRKSWISWFSIL